MLNDGNAFVVANALAALMGVVNLFSLFFKVLLCRFQNQRELIC